MSESSETLAIQEKQKPSILDNEKPVLKSKHAPMFTEQIIKRTLGQFAISSAVAGAATGIEYLVCKNMGIDLDAHTRGIMYQVQANAFFWIGMIFDRGLVKIIRFTPDRKKNPSKNNNINLQPIR